jgi:hypothetical protein
VIEKVERGDMESDKEEDIRYPGGRDQSESEEEDYILAKPEEKTQHRNIKK